MSRLTGPDGLVIEVVSLNGACGVWARFAGVGGPAALLATRHGAYVGAYPDAEALAADIELTALK